MWTFIRILVLVCGFVLGIMYAEEINAPFPSPIHLWFSITFIFGFVFPWISGLGSLLKKRDLPYLISPRFSTSPFDKRVILQFEHLLSFLFITIGVAWIIRDLTSSEDQLDWANPMQGVVLGVGMQIGIFTVLTVFRTRFEKPIAEQGEDANPDHVTS